MPTLFGALHSQQADTGYFEGEQAGLAAYTPDGRFITQLFRDFNTFKNALTPLPKVVRLAPGELPPGMALPPGFKLPPPQAPVGNPAP